MRLRLARRILQLHVWLSRHHKPIQESFLDHPTCAWDAEYWPCKVRRETDERARRLPS